MEKFKYTFEYIYILTIGGVLILCEDVQRTLQGEGKVVVKIRVSEGLYREMVKYVMEKYGVVSRYLGDLVEEALTAYLKQKMSSPEPPKNFISRHYVSRFGRSIKMTTTMNREVKRMLDEYVGELSKKHGMNYGLKRAIVEEALKEYIKVT